MILKVYYGDKPQYKHEFEQIKEIIEALSDKFSEEDIFVLSNVLIANGDIDCVLLTKRGPIILELKAYAGEVIGDENSDWYVKTKSGDVPLTGNLFQQLRNQRNDLFNKLDKIRKRHFPRIDKEDLRKVSAWGYFSRGSTFPEHQINFRIVKWFDIVTADTLVDKVKWQNSGYTLSIKDMETIVKELHLTEWSEDLLSGIDGLSTPSNQLESSTPNEDTQVSEFGCYPRDKIISVIEKMAPNGHAPDDGCLLFDIGNDSYISALKRVYLGNGFKRGVSAEKFIVGPFGSGKSHFVKLLCEVARNAGCVTATVSLNKQIDVTSNYYIYRETAREIRAPGSGNRGISSLLMASIESVKSMVREQSQDDSAAADDLVRLWIESLESEDFESDMFGRVARQAFDAFVKNDREKYDAACRWIAGEFENKEIAKLLNLSPTNKPELDRIATRVNHSLYQLIKKAGFPGTVIVFDEAEQGFEISSHKQSVLYSLMQSDINAINDLKNGSVLILYAILPSVKEGMMNFPALQQRVQHPIPFDRNPRAPLIEISRKDATSKEKIIEELLSIGNRLVDLMFYATDGVLTVPREEVYHAVKRLAERAYSEDMSISDRRMLVKGTCTLLMELYDTGSLLDPADIELKTLVAGVDDEV